MKFGPVAPEDALGATAVHSIRQGDLVLKKGKLIGPLEVAALLGNDPSLLLLALIPLAPEEDAYLCASAPCARGSR